MTNLRTLREVWKNHSSKIGLSAIARRASREVFYPLLPDGLTFGSFALNVDLGDEGTYDTVHTYAPCVIKDGETYKMWYSGNNGSNYRIIYCTSSDGITWSNHQMVINIGDEGTYDVSTVFGCTVIKDGSTYKMWYTGSASSVYRIIYCTSNDGVNWSNHQMVINIGDEGTYDTVLSYLPSVVKLDSTYHMWYSGTNGSNVRIIHCDSSNGTSWNNHQMVVDINQEGTYDVTHAYSPSVYRYNNQYIMFYSGIDGSGDYRNLRCVSSDGVNWSDYQMVVDKGSEGTYDAKFSSSPGMLVDGSNLIMYYSGYDSSNVWRILRAVATS